MRFSRRLEELDQAARVLELAQQTADTAITDAKREAERIVAAARQEAEEIRRQARAEAGGAGWPG